MATTKIIWEDNTIISIQHNSHEYYALNTSWTLEDGHYYVFVRRDDGRYGVLETTCDEVLNIVASNYDDIYYYDCNVDVNKYSSIEALFIRDDKEALSHGMSYDDFNYPLCLVHKGVEGLLTCRPVIFDKYAESGNGWMFGRSFVCESFTNEYIIINGCVIRYNMHVGEYDKAWYGEHHEIVHYDDGGYNNWASYKYQQRFDHIGKWLVIDENNPETFVDDIDGEDIIMADFWSSFIVVCATLKGDKYLYFWDKEPVIKFRARIICSGWSTYYTKRHSLFFIKTDGGIQIYSGQAGLLSEKTYFFNTPGHEYLHNESLVLQYYTKDKSVAQDILYIDNEGNVVINKS